VQNATFTPKQQYVAAGLLLAAAAVVAVLAGVEDAITGARFNAAFGEPTPVYKVRIVASSAAEFFLLAAPGLLLAIRGRRWLALLPMTLLAVGRATAPVEPGFEAVVALVWLALAACPVVWLMRVASDRPQLTMPATVWILVSIAVTGLIVWYVEVIFSPTGRLSGAPVAYAAFLAFGLLLGTPKGWWLPAHGLLLGLALTANGIAYGWLSSTIPITADPWSLATLMGPVMAGGIGSAAHRVTVPDTSTKLASRAA
jgi:hypothetical protein